MRTSRSFQDDTLVLSTHNKGKIVEISTLLAPFKIKVLASADLGLPEPEETGATFAENAAIKALAAAKQSSYAALADDSGLAVTALSGAPGIFSARWAGSEKDFQKAMSLVHEKIGDNPDRSAAFVCALALAWPDGHIETTEGRCEGAITWPPRGSGGFGYDPFFIPNGHERTFGEMTPAEKQALSHRAKAFHALIARCFSKDQTA